jgi:hypothetical protein
VDGHDSSFHALLARRGQHKTLPHSPSIHEQLHDAAVLAAIQQLARFGVPGT